MKLRNILIVLLTIHYSLFIIHCSSAQTPKWLWAKNSGQCQPYSDATDIYGNVIIVGGSYKNGIDFIEKYDSNGNVLWSKSIDGDGDSDGARGVATDKSGNIYVTGSFNGDSIKFGNYILRPHIPNADVFIVKYSPSGDVIWAKSAGGKCGFTNGFSITVDDSDNVFICGLFQSLSLTFDTITIYNLDTICEDIYFESFIAKYDSTGKALWAKRVGVILGNFAYALSVSVDHSGNAYLSGYFTGPSITIDNFTLHRGGNFSMYIIKLDTHGNVLWGKTGKGNVEALYVTTDAVNNCYIAGQFNEPTLILGHDTLTSQQFNFFLIKYDSSGNILWARDADKNSVVAATSVTTDKSGNVYVAGDFANQPLIIDSIESTGNHGIFIASFDSKGNFLWVKSSTCGNTNMKSIASDNIGNIYMTGYSQLGQISFDTITLTSCNGFIAKLAPSIITNVKNIEKNNNFSIYPNPTNSQLNIDIGSYNKLIELTITDITGREIYRNSISNNSNPTSKITINTGGYIPGVYLAYIQSAEYSTTKKIIVIK